MMLIHLIGAPLRLLKIDERINSLLNLNGCVFCSQNVPSSRLTVTVRVYVLAAMVRGVQD